MPDESNYLGQTPGNDRKTRHTAMLRARRIELNAMRGLKLLLLSLLAGLFSLSPVNPAELQLCQHVADQYACRIEFTTLILARTARALWRTELRRQGASRAQPRALPEDAAQLGGFSLSPRQPRCSVGRLLDAPVSTSPLVSARNTRVTKPVFIHPLYGGKAMSGG